MKRIQRKRTKGWKIPSNTVYVGRPSRWGNPFKIDSYMNREGCIKAFREKLTQEQAENPQRFEEYYLKPLRKKNLGCWCFLTEICHADIWFEFLKENK